MIWLLLVAVVFVGGGAFLVARKWRTRGIVFFAGLVAVIGYFAIGKPNMHDDPLAGRLKVLAAKPETELTGTEFLALQEDLARKSPNDPEPHKKIGDLYAAAGQADEAMFSYSAALRRDPAYQPAMDAISELEFRQTGEVDQATRERLPQIREQAGKNAESLTTVQFMVLLEERAAQVPNDPAPYRYMGDILERIGHPDKAAVAYAEAVKRDPKDMETVKSLADARFKSAGKVDPETAELYNRVYKANPGDLRVGYMAGIGEWSAGRKDKARAMLAEIDARTPTDGPYPQMFAALRQMFGIDPPPPGAPQSEQPPAPPAER